MAWFMGVCLRAVGGENNLPSVLALEGNFMRKMLKTDTEVSANKVNTDVALRAFLVGEGLVDVRPFFESLGVDVGDQHGLLDVGKSS